MIKDKIIAIIPFRAGSKGLKDKNIKSLNELPLYYYSVKFAKSLGIDFIISTDYSFQKLEKYIKRRSYLKRPSELASDKAIMEDVILNILQNKNLSSYNTCLLLQPTSPLRSLETFNELYKSYNSCGLSGISLTVKEVSKSLWKTGFFNNDKFVNIAGDNKLFFKNRQDLDDLFTPDGSMYLFNIDEYIQKGSFDVKKINAIMNDERCSIDIDGIRDFEKADKQIKTLSGHEFSWFY